MGPIRDIYTLIRDLIDEAKKQKFYELADKLIDIKLAVSELQEENEKLKKRISLNERIIRHVDGNYVTLKDENPEIKYCSTCWGKEGKLIQLDEGWDNYDEVPKCPECRNALIRAKNSGK